MSGVYIRSFWDYAQKPQAFLLRYKNVHAHSPGAFFRATRLTSTMCAYVNAWGGGSARVQFGFHEFPLLAAAAFLRYAAVLRLVREASLVQVVAFEVDAPSNAPSQPQGYSSQALRFGCWGKVAR
jgi:hypothetical protein